MYGKNKNQIEFFNKSRTVLRNFKDSSLLCPMMKRENMNKAVSMHILFENLFK
jgi:hypothetical protein